MWNDTRKQWRNYEETWNKFRKTLHVVNFKKILGKFQKNYGNLGEILKNSRITFKKSRKNSEDPSKIILRNFRVTSGTVDFRKIWRNEKFLENCWKNFWELKKFFWILGRETCKSLKIEKIYNVYSHLKIILTTYLQKMWFRNFFLFRYNYLTEVAEIMEKF